MRRDPRSFSPSLPVVVLVLSGMFSDGLYTYGIEPLSNGSHPVIITPIDMGIASVFEEPPSSVGSVFRRMAHT